MARQHVRRAQARVKRCGKSAPAPWRHGGQANPTRCKAKQDRLQAARQGPGRPLRWMAAQRQNPAYRLATEKPRKRGAFLCPTRGTSCSVELEPTTAPSAPMAIRRGRSKPPSGTGRSRRAVASTRRPRAGYRSRHAALPGRTSGAPCRMRPDAWRLDPAIRGQDASSRTASRARRLDPGIGGQHAIRCAGPKPARRQPQLARAPSPGCRSRRAVALAGLSPSPPPRPLPVASCRPSPRALRPASLHRRPRAPCRSLPAVPRRERCGRSLHRWLSPRGAGRPRQLAPRQPAASCARHPASGGGPATPRYLRSPSLRAQVGPLRRATQARRVRPRPAASAFVTPARRLRPRPPPALPRACRASVRHARTRRAAAFAGPCFPAG